MKQLLAAFSPDNESGLKRVVMVPDAAGATRLGFLTKEFEVDGGRGSGRARMPRSTCRPTTSTWATSSSIRRDALRFPDIRVEEGVRIFLTGGMAMADRVSIGLEPPHQLSS